MREIKFRGFDCENKIWRYGHFFETVEGVRRCYNIVEDREIKYYCDVGSISQYTGLKDKKGNEIYEGDILIDKYGTTGECKFHNGYIEYINTAGFIESGSKWEIIGNIYENPELLKISEVK